MGEWRVLYRGEIHNFVTVHLLWKIFVRTYVHVTQDEDVGHKFWMVMSCQTSYWTLDWMAAVMSIRWSRFRP